MKLREEKLIQKQHEKPSSQSDINTFLSQVNSKVNEIRKYEQKKYSLLSCIFNCFYENQTLTLPMKVIYEYIYQDLMKYKNKMIISFVVNGTNSKETITENNYYKKTSSIITKNKCLILLLDSQKGDKISIDTNFVKSHKRLLFGNLFGKEEISQHLSSLKSVKNKNSLNETYDNKIFNTTAEIKDNDGILSENDFEIEIIDTEQEDAVEAPAPTSRKDSKKNVNCSKRIFSPSSDKMNINNMNNSFSNKSETDFQYLKKKRKSKNFKLNKIKEFTERKKRKYRKRLNNTIDHIDNNTKEKSEIKFSDQKENDINKSKEKEKEKEKENDKEKEKEKEKEKKKEKENKDQIILEKEIISLLDNGKMFLSLFKDKNALSELKHKKNTFEGEDPFIKTVLVNYQNGDNIKSYMDMISEDFSEFQKGIKSLIEYKTSLNESNDNKFLTKLSMLNKIILNKEKCCILIDKIIVKIKQLLLEYKFIKKVLNSISENDSDIYKKLKEIVANTNNDQEKESYINNLKSKLQDELIKALILIK